MELAYLFDFTSRIINALLNLFGIALLRMRVTWLMGLFPVFRGCLSILVKEFFVPVHSRVKYHVLTIH